MDDIMHYSMTRRCLTGANEYCFYRDLIPIGTGSALVLPTYPLTLRRNGMELRYNQDPGITLFPGINKAIYEGDAKVNWGRVIWIKHGLHRLDTPMGTFYAHRQGEEFRFLQDERVLAHLYPTQQRVISPQTGTEWEPRLTLAAKEPISDDLALLMLAFPLLQLGL